MKLSRHVVRLSFSDLPDIHRRMRHSGMIWFPDVEPLFELLETSESLCEKAAVALAQERARTAILRRALIECRSLIIASRADPFDKVVALVAEVRSVAGDGIRQRS